MWSTVFFLITVIHGLHGVSIVGIVVVSTPLGDAIINATTSIVLGQKCETSKTILTNGKRPCKDQLLFEDNFEENFINDKKWNLQHYSPITHDSPDFEFVSYEISDETLFVNNSKLIINPVLLTNEEQVSGTLDLRDRCTSANENACFVQQESANILPPIKSARINSKFSFTYGKIEIKAKLPLGDWIYPQILLLPEKKRSSRDTKMWVAYSRGNSIYIGPEGDIGSSVLFGGLVLNSTEPERSSLASTRAHIVPYGEEVHVYTLIWEPEEITMLFNNETYGTYQINRNDKRFKPFSNEFYLSIGIGVGGINDFPDYPFNNRKPWINKEPKQLLKFFNARNTWSPTWDNYKKQMQIDYVKIWAV